MSHNIGKNNAIKCSVTSCQNHCPSANYCALDEIEVGTHEEDPAMTDCTDCKSFQNVNPYEQQQAVAKSKTEKQPGDGQGW